MGHVFQVFREEIFAVSEVMLAGRGFRRERRLDALGTCHLQGAVDFVGGYVVETLALIFLRQRLPIELCGLKQRQSAHHVGAGECERVLDGTVYMAFGSQVDNAVDPLFLHQTVEGVEITDVHLHEPVVGAVLYVLQVGQIAGVGQLVKVDDAIIRILVYEQAHDVAAYESGTAGDHYGSLKFHFLL